MTSCKYIPLHGAHFFQPTTPSSLNSYIGDLTSQSVSQGLSQSPTVKSSYECDLMLICSFLRHKAGNHDTTVHEKVAPAVVQENIVKKRHEEAQTAIDREVHQDHYHTSIQPVQDREVLPEQHKHRMVGVEHREHRHGNAEAVEARLEQERAQFRDVRTETAATETHSVAPVIAGEHKHHHVHEVTSVL